MRLARFLALTFQVLVTIAAPIRDSVIHDGAEETVADLRLTDLTTNDEGSAEHALRDLSYTDSYLPPHVDPDIPSDDDEPHDATYEYSDAALDKRVVTRPKKPATTTPAKPTAITAANVKPPLPPKTYDLTPYVRDFQMAHNLKMVKDSTSVREISSASLREARIPADLTLMQGNFKADTLPRSLLTVTDEERFEDAKGDLENAKRKAGRVGGLKLYGELALQCVMGSSLFEPANGVLAAITGSNKVAWRSVGSGMDDPVPDVVLTVDGRKVAVIEIKTLPALDDTAIATIFRDLSSYKMEMRAVGPEMGSGDQEGGTDKKVMTLVGPTDLRKRGERMDTTKTMEQVLGQMYRHRVTIGALTNLETWLIFEKTGSTVKVTRLDGVVQGKSKAMNIVLAMAYKVAKKAMTQYRKMAT